MEKLLYYIIIPLMTLEYMEIIKNEQKRRDKTWVKTVSLNQAKEHPIMEYI
jgi:hypothetical protein